MSSLRDGYMQKYHGSLRFNEASYIDRDAPVMDASMGLLEAPEYVLFLGLRDEAEGILKKAGCSLVMSQRQFHNEGLGVKYNRRVEVIGE